jgi:UDP-N-acetylmuramate--alanine ligase
MDSSLSAFRGVDGFRQAAAGMRVRVGNREGFMSAIPSSAADKLFKPVFREINAPRLAWPSSKFARKRVHFVGIGGSGMSGLAQMMLDCGALVTGSDAKHNPQIGLLHKRGVRISTAQRGELLSGTIDLVVRSAAVPDSHPEMLAAAAMGLPTMKYAQMLGEVMRERLGIAVAGTHGKSTTTAMAAFALVECGLDPSFVVGGTVPQINNSGSRSGGGDAFVAEACEYDRSFHNLAPTVAMITNIEEDHLDCYKNIDEIIESFRTFAALVPAEGVLIANGRDPNVDKVIAAASCRVQRVAVVGPDESPASTWSTRSKGIVNGCHHGDVHFDGRLIATLRMSVPGLHNLFNATMALAAAVAAGAFPQEAADAIGRFTGVDRRQTEVGTFNGARVVDDYGHHPTEIRITLAALRERYAPKRLICVFQPHQHSRTRHLLGDFATSFAAADETVMPDIFFVRDSEDEKHLVCTEDLVARITAEGHAAVHIPSFDAIVEHLRAEARDGDLIVTMGAGNVNEIGKALVRGI